MCLCCLPLPLDWLGSLCCKTAQIDVPFFFFFFSTELFPHAQMREPGAELACLRTFTSSYFNACLYSVIKGIIFLCGKALFAKNSSAKKWPSHFRRNLFKERAHSASRPKRKCVRTEMSTWGQNAKGRADQEGPDFPRTYIRKSVCRIEPPQASIYLVIPSGLQDSWWQGLKS